MTDWDPRTSVAMREARKFRERLYQQALITQVFMVTILSAMVYFGISEKWMLIVGLFLGVGTVCSLIIECAFRLDAGRSYLEQWSESIEKYIYKKYE